MKNIEFNAESAYSLARLIIMIASGVATYMGWAFDANLWLNIALSILSLVILVYLVWWKNQPITKAAQEAQNVLSNIKVSDYSKAGYDEAVKELQAAAVAQEVENHD